MQDVVILGGHTPVARSLVDRLADRGLESGIVSTTTTEFVEQDLVLFDQAILERTGLLVLATDHDLAKRLAEGVAGRGRPVLDIGEAFDSVPYVWPILAPTVPDSGLQRLAIGPAGPLAALIAALAVFRPKSVRVTTLESAVARGQPGIDELSNLTRGVFAMRDVEPEVFPASLAFDPIPSLSTGDDHPHDADAILVEQVQSALQTVGQAAPDVVVTRVLVPTFVADAMVVHIDTEDPSPEPAIVEGAIAAGRGLRYEPRVLVPALDAVDRDDTLVSRVRVGPHRLDLWLTYDRTRGGSAVPAALAVVQWRQSFNRAV